MVGKVPFVGVEEGAELADGSELAVGDATGVVDAWVPLVV